MILCLGHDAQQLRGRDAGPQGVHRHLPPLGAIPRLTIAIAPSSLIALSNLPFFLD